MQKALYCFCMLLISSNSFCNEFLLNQQFSLVNEPVVSEQTSDKRLNLGYCNPVLNYCSSTFDFQSDQMKSFVLIEKPGIREFAFSNTKDPNCLSLDYDDKATTDELQYDCEAVVEIIGILAN